MHNILQNISRIIGHGSGSETRTRSETRTDYQTVTEFKFALKKLKNICNATYRPNKLMYSQLDYKRDYTKKKTFENVSFSFTEVVGIDFKECKFVNCDFVGTKFIDCEFHQCTFHRCDPHKISFINTYIDPQVFVEMFQNSADLKKQKRKESNKGLWLFQQLHNNAVLTSQSNFAGVAEFNKRKWQRYQLTWNYKNDRIETIWPVFTFRRKWLANVFSWLTIGYGIRPKFLFLWTLPIAAFIFAFNNLYWDCLKITADNEIAVAGNLGNVIIYTLTTHVGINIFTPGSPAGKTMLVFQSGFGLVTTAVFIGLLVRAALR